MIKKEWKESKRNQESEGTTRNLEESKKVKNERTKESKERKKAKNKRTKESKESKESKAKNESKARNLFIPSIPLGHLRRGNANKNLGLTKHRGEPGHPRNKF